jgi:hypothetical protein
MQVAWSLLGWNSQVVCKAVGPNDIGQFVHKCLTIFGGIAFLFGLHGLYYFGDGHPVIDFAIKPSVVLGVPLTSVPITPSNDLQSFNISN